MSNTPKLQTTNRTGHARPPRTILGSWGWLVAVSLFVGVAMGMGVVGFLRDWSFLKNAGGERLGLASVNQAAPPGAAPQGMVWIPGGIFWMGCDDFQDAQPRHKIYVDGFWMDQTEVTNAQFRRFVEETGYVTMAEKKPDLEEILKQLPKGTPPPAKESLVPGSLIFAAPSGPVALNDHSQWWRWTPGADWRHPEGPGSDLKDRENHPVVHVAYRDALAYCEWRTKKEGGTFRLPTEAEWEFAARGGLDRKDYVWGDEQVPQGKWLANTWQGAFPHDNTRKDGFLAAAPAGSFPANGFGLHDMAGNAWEWCADWYHVNYYNFSPLRNPPGPNSSHDPTEPGVSKRVQRGGSFLCSDDYCKRYVPGARGKGEPDSSTNHIGFRCVCSPHGS